MIPQELAVPFAGLFQAMTVAGLLVLGTATCTHLPSDSLSPDSPGPVLSDKSRDVEAQLTETLKEARKLGPGNPLYLSTLFSLATFYREQKIYTEAEALYRELLTIKEERSGPNHPDIIFILEDYASLLRETNRPLEAELLTLRADSIRSAIAHP